MDSWYNATTQYWYMYNLMKRARQNTRALMHKYRTWPVAGQRWIVPDGEAAI